MSIQSILPFRQCMGRTHPKSVYIGQKILKNRVGDAHINTGETAAQNDYMTSRTSGSWHTAKTERSRPSCLRSTSESKESVDKILYWDYCCYFKYQLNVSSICLPMRARQKNSELTLILKPHSVFTTHFEVEIALNLFTL